MRKLIRNVQQCAEEDWTSLFSYNLIMRFLNLFPNQTPWKLLDVYYRLIWYIWTKINSGWTCRFHWKPVLWTIYGKGSSESNHNYLPHVKQFTPSQPLFLKVHLEPTNSFWNWHYVGFIITYRHSHKHMYTHIHTFTMTNAYTLVF